MKPIRIFILVSFLSGFIFTVNALAQADEFIERGLLAVKQKQWELAIKYFKEAQDKDFFNPEVIFNLALAYDKAGGRELFSLAYYRAYLALAADAQNSKQVRARIAELEIKLEGEARNLIRKAKESLSGVPEKDRSIPYGGIVSALINVGDISGALSLAVSSPLDASYKMYDFSDIARAQAAAGDVEAARQTAAKLASITEDETSRKSAVNHVLSAIVNEQAKKGDFAGAKKTIESMTDELSRRFAYISIMEYQLKAKDIAAAEQTSAFIKDNDDSLADAYTVIAKVKAEMGDLAGAKKYINLAKDKIAKAVSPLPDIAPIDDQTILHLAMAEASTGDIEAARKTAEPLKKEAYAVASYISYLNEAISQAQTRAGKLDEAKKAVSEIPDYYSRARAYKDIVQAQIQKNDTKGARQTAELIEPKDIKYAALSLIKRAEGQAKEAKAYSIFAVMNDPAFKEMEVLPDFIATFKVKEPKWITWALSNTASNLVNFMRKLREA